MGDRALWVAAGLLFAGSVLLYFPSFGHDFIRGYDDSTYVLDNPHVLDGLTPAGVVWAFTTNYAVNWLPLTWLSHMLDVSLFGTNPVGHHATGILLHGVNAALLLLALRRLTGRFGLSLATAALFAVHPLRVESVSWVAERKDVLSGAFFMAALWAYACYAERPTARRYLLVALLHALGLMAKTMLVTLPCVLLLLDWWPLRRVAVGRLLPPPAVGELGPAAGRGPPPPPRPPAAPATVRRVLLEKVPLLALSLVASAWTVVFQKEGGAMGFGATLSLADRLSTAVVCVPRYLLSMFWPSGLAVLYPHPGHWPAWQVAASAGSIAVVTAACWLARRRMPYLLVGWLWFLGMLVPVSGVVQVGFQSMADRYTYLPAVGVTLAAVGLAADGLRWMAGRVWHPAGGGRVGWAVGGTVAAVLCGLTVRQQAYWTDSFTLFSRALAVTEGNWMAHGHVGTALYGRGDEAAALAHFRQALAINPGFANAHYNIGLVMAARGSLDEAVAEYREAIRSDPRHVRAFYELGELYLNRKRMPNEAVDPLTRAVEIEPVWPEAQALLAQALAASGRSAEAGARLGVAGRNPAAAAEVQMGLGVGLTNAGKLPEAAAAFGEAAKLDPGNARTHYNLGFTLGQLGRYDEAEREIAEAVRLDPQNDRAARLLRNLRSRPGR